MSFETMIDYGGTGWRVDTEIDAIQATGPICRRFQFSGPSNTLNFDKTVVLTSEYPEGSFGNIDRSLVPPNTLVVGRGWSLQNQTSLPGYVLDKFPLPIVSSKGINDKIATQLILCMNRKSRRKYGIISKQYRLETTHIRFTLMT
jgi:hypothetical protein